MQQRTLCVIMRRCVHMTLITCVPSGAGRPSCAVMSPLVSSCRCKKQHFRFSHDPCDAVSPDPSTHLPATSANPRFAKTSLLTQLCAELRPETSNKLQGQAAPRRSSWPGIGDWVVPRPLHAWTRLDSNSRGPDVQCSSFRHPERSP